jgi:putative two-component system response regulator
MEIIKEHCILGERLCRPVMALQPVLPIIRHHHERGDGSGYPDKLRSGQIPPLVEVFSIVDVYDSLRTWRPYRPPLSQQHAVDLMRSEVLQGYWNRDFFESFAQNVVPILDDHFRIAKVHWPVN